LVEETEEKPPTCGELYHIMLHQVHLGVAWGGIIELTALVVIGTDCIGSYRFNYHTITTMKAPRRLDTIWIPKTTI